MADSYLTSTDYWYANYCDCAVKAEKIFFYSTFDKNHLLMNHLLATYIDFIQCVGLIFLTIMAVFITRKLFLDNKHDNHIEAVKIKVDEWIFC